MPYCSWPVRYCCICRRTWKGLSCGTGFNFLSHGSQDLYPTYLQTTKGFDRYHSIVATIIGNVGAITCVSHTDFLLYMRIHFLQRRGNRRLYFAAYRPPAYDYFVCHAKRGLHSTLDSSIWLQYACSWRILCAIWRTGCVGCDPHTARRDEPTRIPCYLPWCCIPTRKRTRFCYTV